MKYRLFIVLFGLPKTTNGSHGSWFAAAAERKKWRKMVAKSVLVHGRPENPLAEARLICTRYSSSKPDYDNLTISFKSLVDGLRDAKVILDDKDAVIIERKYLWEKTPKNQGRVSLVVEEI